MLTARDAAESRIKGLEIGADDYRRKPFEPRELSLRIANILKRAQPGRAAAPVENRCASAPFVFHLGARRAAQRRGGHPPDRPRARDAAHSRGDAGRNRAAHGARRQRRRVSERAVDVQVNRLRRKIERDPANPLFVQTVRGIGYRLVIAS